MEKKTDKSPVEQMREWLQAQASEALGKSEEYWKGRYVGANLAIDMLNHLFPEVQQVPTGTYGDMTCDEAVQQYNAATLKWRKIDPNQEYVEEIMVLNPINGNLQFYRNCKGADIDIRHGYTHYILVSDLLQFPKED